MGTDGAGTNEFADQLQGIVKQVHPDLRAEEQRNLEDTLKAGGDSFEGLLRLVADTTIAGKIRQFVCSLLGRLGDQRALATMLAAMKDDDPGVRKTAVWSAERLGNKSTVWSLLAALKDRDAGVRAQAAMDVGGLRDKHALKPLIKAMQGDPDPTVRDCAAYGLGWLRDSRATEALLGVMNNPAEMATVRGTAAEQLANIGDPRAIPPLIQALNDPCPDVRFWAAYTLGFMGANEAIPALRSLGAHDNTVVPGWWSIDREARDALRAIRRSELSRTVEQFLRERRRSYRKISLVLDDRTNPLAKRIAACGALGCIGDERAIPMLRSLLEDSTQPEELRHVAVQSLWRIGGKKVIAPTVSALLLDESMEVRHEAVETLGWLRDKRSASALLGVVMNGREHADVRGKAAEILTMGVWSGTKEGEQGTGEAPTYIGDRHITPALVAALNDPDYMVRRCAIAGLGNYGSPEALSALRELLKLEEDASRGDSRLRAATECAIEQITKRHGEPEH